MSRTAAGLFILGAAALLVCVLRFLSGGTGFGWPAADIAEYRARAVASGAAVGAALAISGLFLQVLLRNPLASPFVLGISSGAGLGYVLGLLLGWRLGVDLSSASGVVGVAGPVLTATVGGLATLVVVWRLGTKRGTVDPLTLVLAGVVVSSICGAGIMTVQSILPNALRGDAVGWMMGRVPEAPPRGLLVAVAALAAVGVGVGAWRGRALDAAMLSDDEAISVGVALPRLRVELFVVAGILASATVTLCGPIAFVGLVAPHVARLVLGARHRPLALGAAFAGIALLVAADAARQGIDFGAGRLPVGVLTALVGGPIFLWLLRSGRGAP